MSGSGTSGGPTETPPRGSGDLQEEATVTYAHGATTARAFRPLQRGQSLGRFVVLELLGSGGMGVVYSAYDPQLDRRIALKLLRPFEVSAPGRAATEARLLREARALARLTDPHVVTVYDAGAVDGRVFVAMELVPGIDLEDWLREEPPVDEILDAFLQAGRGLEAAHQQGLIHRDFKPSNVMRREDGRVQVLDFGLARPPKELSGEGEALGAEALVAGPVPSDAPPATLPGAVMGTPGYMAPEQLAGGETGPRTDQWAFCVALFRALYGRRPFSAPRAGHPEDWQVEIPDSPWLAPRTRRALERGLAFRPEDRHSSMTALLSALSPPERNRRLAAIAGLGIALTLGAASFLALRPEPLCPDATPHLAGIWDEERRGHLTSALRATERSYADGVAASAASLFDAYAEAWVAMRGEACRATRVLGEQSSELLDRRMLCLDQRRDELAATVDLLSQEATATVERAVQMATGLEPLSVCADPVALLAPVPLPDPELAANVATLRERLAVARARQLAGQAETARDTIAEVLEAAESLGYWPLVAEARQRLAAGDEQLERPAAAEEGYREALLAAQAGGHDRVAAEALVRLVRVVGYQRADLAAGRRWADLATGAVGRLRGATGLEAVLEDHRGVLALRGGELATAGNHHRRAIAAHRALGPAHQAALARSLVRLANVELAGEQPEAARPSLEEAFAIHRELFGHGHPKTAETRERLAVAALQAGDRETAGEHLIAALSIFRTVYGEHHPSVASTRVHLGQVHAQGGAHGTAQEHFRAAAEIYTEAYGPQHPHVAFALSSLGSSLAEAGRLREARELLLRVLEIQRAAHGEDHPWLATSHHNLGDIAARLGDYAEAEARHRRALELWETAHGPEHRLVALALIGRGRAQRGLERTESVQTLERALDLAQRLRLPTHELAEARFELARALTATGEDRPRALDLARAALAEYRAAGGPHHEAAQGITTWLEKHGASGKENQPVD